MVQKYCVPAEVRALFSTVKKPHIVSVPLCSYLAFNGSGHPGSDDFQRACNALFSISYIIKFKIARVEMNLDYAVMPLEVNWHLDKSTYDQDGVIKFTWEAMIMQPSFVTEQHFQRAVEMAREAGKMADFERLYYLQVQPHLAVQAFHKGDYNTMNDTLETMKVLADLGGYVHGGTTHDVYLNDSRKTRTENLKSVMRLVIQK